MPETPTEAAQNRVGRTRWRRFAMMAVPATVAVSAMFVAMGQGALAASFTVSGQPAKISADSLDGTGFVQYGWVDGTARGEAIPVTTSAMKDAKIVNLCQSVLISLPLLGDFTLLIKAGGGDTPVTAENLFIDMEQIQGDAVFTNIEIGNDASKLNKGPRGATGFQDMFSQQADKVHIDNLRQVAYSTSAGTFRLAGLNLTLDKGKNECF